MPERNSGPGMVSELERAAMNGESMPKGLNGAEMVEFFGLDYLYRAFRAGLLSREDASAQKKKMLGELDKIKRRKSMDDSLIEHTRNLWRTVGRYSDEYRKDRTLERADNIWRAAYDLLRNIPQAVSIVDGFSYCPYCGRLFNPAHAARKPRFCEDCGTELRWPD